MTTLQHRVQRINARLILLEGEVADNGAERDDIDLLRELLDRIDDLATDYISRIK